MALNADASIRLDRTYLFSKEGQVAKRSFAGGVADAISKSKKITILLQTQPAPY